MASSAVLALASFSPIASAQLVSVPGTSISLEPPAGFTLSEQFSGFVNLDDFSSIVITELPLEGYPGIAATFSSIETATKNFASQGIVVEEVSTITVGEIQIPLLKGVQNVNNISVDKYIALLRGNTTILLVFNVTDRDRLEEAAVVAAIESIKIAPTPSVEEQIAQLPFTFEVAAPFQVLQTVSGSSVVITPNGEPDPSGKGPLIIIASSIGSVVETSDLAVFAERLLRETRGFSAARITEQSQLDFAGGDGYFIKANVPEGSISQYLRSTANTSYVRLIVSGESQEVQRVMPAIQVIIDSVQVKDGE